MLLYLLKNQVLKFSFCRFNKNNTGISKPILFTFGYSSYGQCGHGDTNNCLSPKQVEFFNDKSIVLVGAGGASSYVYTQGIICYFIYLKMIFQMEIFIHLDGMKMANLVLDRLTKIPTYQHFFHGNHQHNSRKLLVDGIMFYF